MESGLVLWADEDHVSVRQVVDVDSGEVREERVSAVELCESLGVQYQPMTRAVKELVLFTRKGKNGNADEPVRVGDLGPLILAKVASGVVENRFVASDFGKPMRLSVDSIRELARIFGDGKANIELQKPRDAQGNDVLKS